MPVLPPQGQKGNKGDHGSPGLPGFMGPRGPQVSQELPGGQDALLLGEVQAPFPITHCVLGSTCSGGVPGCGHTHVVGRQWCALADMGTQRSAAWDSQLQRSLSVGPWTSLVASVPELCHSNADIRAHTSDPRTSRALRKPFE